jgi:hypothetical protein
MKQSLAKKCPDSPAWKECDYLEPGIPCQCAQAKLRVAIKVVRFLVPGPIHGSREQNLSTGPEQPIKLAPDSKRVGDVLQNFGAENGIEGCVRKRNFVSRACKIDVTSFWVKVASPLASDMHEVAGIRLAATPDVEQLTREFLRKQGDAPFDEHNVNVCMVSQILPHAGAESAIRVEVAEGGLKQIGLIWFHMNEVRNPNAGVSGWKQKKQYQAKA